MTEIKINTFGAKPNEAAYVTMIKPTILTNPFQTIRGARVLMSEVAQSNAAPISIKDTPNTTVIIKVSAWGAISAEIIMPSAIGKLNSAVICTNFLNIFSSLILFL